MEVLQVRVQNLGTEFTQCTTFLECFKVLCFVLVYIRNVGISKNVYMFLCALYIWGIYLLGASLVQTCVVLH